MAVSPRYCGALLSECGADERMEGIALRIFFM